MNTVYENNDPRVVKADELESAVACEGSPEAASFALHSDHLDGEMHHHHSHSDSSRHPGHHHLLSVEHLSVSFRMYDETEPYFKAQQRLVPVIDDLSISVHEGEIVAIVGASGSGKTILADSIMGLFEPNAQVKGDVYFDGEQVGSPELQALRGHGISLVPQSVSYLNPLIRVGRQVEGFARQGMSIADRRRRREELFAHYGLEPKVAKLYPFELSGGMARRVLLCCALMDNPKLIIADEPTPGLDLPLAVRALQDFREFANQGGGVMLITHDIELALSVADRIAVFREGTIVEETAVANFASPDLLRHPFSRALWYALPEHDFAVTESSLLSKSNTASQGYQGDSALDNALNSSSPNTQQAIYDAEHAAAIAIAEAANDTFAAYPDEVVGLGNSCAPGVPKASGALGEKEESVASMKADE